MTFKAHTGVWLPIDIATKKIPQAPSPQQRLAVLLVEARRLHGEITDLIETTHPYRA